MKFDFDYGFDTAPASITPANWKNLILDLDDAGNSGDDWFQQLGENLLDEVSDDDIALYCFEEATLPELLDCMTFDSADVEVNHYMCVVHFHVDFDESKLKI